MRPAQRTGTTHPARPADHFQKSPRYSKIRHFSPHPHTIIRYPQSQTLSTLRYHTLIFIRSLTQQTLLVLFKCIEIIAIRILHPCQIQQRPKLRARLIETFKDSQQKFKSRDTHTGRKRFNNKRTMYHHSNDLRERNRYRKTSSYTTEGFRSRNLSYTPTRTSHQYTADIRPQPH